MSKKAKTETTEKKAKESALVVLARELNELLNPKPLLDLAIKETQLKKDIVEMFPSIEPGDELSEAAMKTLKDLGYGAKAKKVEKDSEAGEDGEAKPAKADKSAKVKKDKAPKGPGVIATIVEVLKKGKPVTKEAILEVLVKRFPDRSAESMGKTINVQVPTRISKEQGLKIVHSDKGYSIK